MIWEAFEAQSQAPVIGHCLSPPSKERVINDNNPDLNDLEVQRTTPRLSSSRLRENSNSSSTISRGAWHGKFSRGSVESLRSLRLTTKLCDFHIFSKVDAESSKELEQWNEMLRNDTWLRFPGIDYSDASVSVEDLEHHADSYKIKHSGAARMFYLFFELQDSRKDLVVIWLIGGLGHSSELAVFYENRLFTIAKNLPLLWIEFSWDKAFFEEHSQFVDNDFYVTGESYARHYNLAFVARVHRGNKANEGIHMKLKGFGIGNGLTNPQIQYKAYTVMH
ncbi:Serine carboxypeptidase-like 48 [Vitis vinifera]|uniref:Serine carboxypeptidase-like 48 n=1 Tax=Vitis vinifera TaxID=29760 RepID=A0A438E783_VITVI|nr:Serine carboxypeptidase-like 48 [Vitis vinifera]